MGCFVTTLDNPYNFFTQFDEWYAFDTAKGYNTCSYIARICNASNGMSESDYDKEVEKAVNDIVRLNLTGNYRKIYDNDTGINIDANESEEKSNENNENLDENDEKTDEEKPIENN